MKLSQKKYIALGGFAVAMGLFVFFANSLPLLAASQGSTTIFVTTNAYCGNGLLESGEQCDDGNGVNGDGCSSSCRSESGAPVIPEVPPKSPAVCGNGLLESGEQCDDGNGVNGDGCSSSCLKEALPVCGNGLLESGEQCDDGNGVNGDGCTSNCRSEQPMCGNGIVEAGEQCDDHNKVNGDGCSALCFIENPNVCGNGIVEAGEQCDDHNKVNGDGCSALCFIEAAATCSNGKLDPGEQCDDGNKVNGDGCSSSCFLEKAIDKAICGNGKVESGEQCDDGNTNSNDGCNASCTAFDGPIGSPEKNPTDAPKDNPVVGFIGNTIGSIGGAIASSTVGKTVQDAVEKINQAIDQLGNSEVLKNTVSNLEKVGIPVTRALNLVKSTNKNVRSEAALVSKAIKVAVEDPEVQATARQVVAPTAAAISVAATAPSLIGMLIPLMRLVFFQPLLLVGRRRREAWGVVYNSLNKLPLDLATVRLVDTATNKIIQSRVTDSLGRYLFSAPPGSYRLEVLKNNFAFPTTLLKDQSADGQKVDLYHGEPIVITDTQAVITPNVPLDPSGATKTPRRIIWERRGRIFQKIMSLLGVVTTAISYLISPAWYVGAFLVIQVLVYVGFNRLTKVKKPKGWGIVYEEGTKEPIGKAIARLFSKQYNKLVATEITDSAGRYSFLVGPNDYYITVEKNGFEKSVKDVHVKNTDAPIVKEDVSLLKNKE